MPFRSKAQRRFMFARHPQIAKRWEDEYGAGKGLPEHAGDRAARKRALKHPPHRRGRRHRG